MVRLMFFAVFRLSRNNGCDLKENSSVGHLDA